MARNKNLCDSRGGTFGIRFFLLMLKLLGPDRTCEFVWVIAFFYTCFDRKAREAARPYLSRRFPGAGRLAMFRHIWALFTSQGQAIVESAAMTQKKLHWEFIDEYLSEQLMDQEKGFILLTSHFGAWNAIMGGLHVARKPVNILVTPDRNRNIDKTLALSGLKNPVKIISTESDMGGLIAVFDAIEQGEIVCIWATAVWRAKAWNWNFSEKRRNFRVRRSILPRARTARYFRFSRSVNTAIRNSPRCMVPSSGPN